MSKSLGDLFVRSIVVGLGRKAGIDTMKNVEKSLAKKIINPNSKLRKQIKSFVIGGNAKNSLGKLTQLISLYYEEYSMGKSSFQYIYMEEDKIFIEKYVAFVEEHQIVSTLDIVEMNALKEMWRKVKSTC